MAWSQATCSNNSALKTNQPKSWFFLLTRGKIFSLKVSEASLVQFRVNTYDLAYIKGLLAQRSPVSFSYK